MTNSEYLTWQYYTWEYRTRGWHLEDIPVHIEPPFMPFIHHLPPIDYIDDGKRHTIASYALELFSGNHKAKPKEDFTLDYEEMEVFPFDDDSGLKIFQVKVPKERNITPERMKALLTMISFDSGIISFEILGNEKEITDFDPSFRVRTAINDGASGRQQISTWPEDWQRVLW